MAKIRLKDIVTLDFETFYSTEYSLTKKAYNLSSYIRDPQFFAQCVAIRDGLKSAQWYPYGEIEKALEKHRVHERPVLSHNTQFDGFILSEHYGIVPPYYLDTLAMTRGLHGNLGRADLDTVSKLYGRTGKIQGALANVKGIRKPTGEALDKLGDYCAVDTDECFEVARIQLKVYPQDELDLIDWTIRCFCDPVLQLDQKLVQEEYDEQVDTKAYKQRIAQVPPELLLSNERFAQALLALGVEPPMKISPRTGLPTYAFAKSDANFKALLNHDDDRVVALVEARLVTKSTIGETRAKRFLDMGNKTLPVAYNYALAHTLRWTGGNKINLQNLNRGGRLRAAIKTPRGHVMTPTDSNQIEARCIGWLAGHETLLQAFRDHDSGVGEGVYEKQAAMIYNKEPGDVAKLERFIGKVCTLGLGFGMGPEKFQATLAVGQMGPPVHIDLQEAIRIVYLYREVNKPIVEFWRQCESILAQMMMKQSGSYKCIEWEDTTIWLPNGLGLHYHGLSALFDPANDRFYDFTYLSRKKPTKIYGGLLAENITQAIARVIVGEQLLKVNKQYRVVGMSHDEIIPIAPKAKGEECLQYSVQTMSQSPIWAPDLPLSAEGDIRTRYGKMP